jgi:hypothetical protein
MPRKSKDDNFIPWTLSEYKQEVKHTKPKQLQPRLNRELPDANTLDIIPYKIDKNEIKLPPMMINDTIPRHPFRMLNSGASGSGKSMLVLNLLKRRNFMEGFFDEIFLFSPTARGDQIQILLDLDSDHICDDLTDSGIEQLDYIFNKQNELIETNGYLKAPKVLIIFDDVISSPRFMNSNVFKRCFIQGRHISLSVIVNTQKYHAIPRTMRLNCTDICFFPSSQSEVARIAEEYTPPSKTVKQFTSLIDYATSEPYNFLYINTRARRKYRKNLGLYLDL